VAALHGVSLTVEEGEIVGVIGANGAGKSTTLRAISGLMRPQAGEISYDGASLAGVASEEIVRRGVAHVPEGRRIFPGLTVVENLEVAAAWRRLGRRERAREVEQVLDSFPRLARRRTSHGWSLSGGEQQMLAIGRALLARPRLLLLDEPSLGLAPNLIAQLFERIQEINRAGTAVLLVEQNAFMALKICARAYVMETGRTVLSGPAASLARDPAVRGRYFG
jgi:branched-chain amino acid transport system ATP-binding protein